MFNLKKIFRRKDNIFEGSDMKWLEDIRAQGHSFTPDLWELEQRAANLIFIYNECQQGQYQHEPLCNSYECTFKGDDVYTTDKFVLYKKNLGLETFPIAFKTHFNQQHGQFNYISNSLLGRTAPIKGEVYAMSAHCIKMLDNYLLNTVQFNRQRVKVSVPFRPNNKLEPYLRRNNLGGIMQETVECFMYIGRYDFFKDQLDGNKILFSPVKLYNGSGEAYYYFNDKIETNTTGGVPVMHVGRT